MKCIEDEIPFDVPAGWEWCRIGTVFETLTGGTPSTKDGSLYGDEYPFYKPTDLDAGFNTCDAINKVSEKGYLTGRIVTQNSVLVTCIGATIGKTGYIRKKGICNQQINAILPIEYIFPEYIFFAMCSEYEQMQIKSSASATTLPILNKSKFDRLIIVIPPMSQQKKIVSKIKEIFAFVKDIETSKFELETAIFNIKLKILHLAISGKLVPQDPNDESAGVLLERIRTEKEKLIKQGKIKRDKRESVIFRGDDNSYYEKMGNKIENIGSVIPFEIPNTWQWCRGFSCFMGMENKKPSGECFNYIDIDSIDNYLHKIKEPKHLSVSEAPSRANRAVCKGSVLFSLVRPYLENIALIEEDYTNCIVSTGFYVCNSSGILDPEYMFYIMTSGYVVNGLSQYMKGDNSPSISKDNIENWLYPIPPLNEQRNICQKLKNIFCKIETVEKSLS